MQTRNHGKKGLWEDLGRSSNLPHCFNWCFFQTQRELPLAEQITELVFLKNFVISTLITGPAFLTWCNLTLHPLLLQEIWLWRFGPCGQLQTVAKEGKTVTKPNQTETKIYSSSDKACLLSTSVGFWPPMCYTRSTLILILNQTCHYFLIIRRFPQRGNDNNRRWTGEQIQHDASSVHWQAISLFWICDSQVNVLPCHILLHSNNSYLLPLLPAPSRPLQPSTYLSDKVILYN